MVMRFLIGVLVAAFMMTGDAVAKSQNKAAQSEHETKTDDRGTENHPFFVKTVPAEKSAEDTAQEQAERESKEAVDKRLLDLTEDLVWVGVFQWGVFFLQLVAFAVQACYLSKTIKEMKAGTATAEKTAKAAMKSADAAVGAEMPILFVVNVDIQITAGGGGHVLENPYQIVVTTKNYGRTAAFMERAIINADIAEQLPVVPSYREELIVDIPDASSSMHRHPFVQRAYSTTFDLDSIKSVIDESSTYWVYGYFVYRDFMDNEHTRGFVWSLDNERGRFIREKNPAYDYYSLKEPGAMAA